MVLERAVYTAAKVIDPKSSNSDERPKRVEKEITFTVKNKAMPAACTHTSTRSTYMHGGKRVS